MISGVVLAAGLSSRMGRPKQHVLLAGRPMLDHTVDAFLSSSVDEVIVVLREGVAPTPVKDGARLRLVTNRDPERGLSSSLILGLRSAKGECEAAVIGLGDKPLVSPSTIDLLVATYRRTGSKIIIPAFKGTRGNPILFDRSLFPSILRLKGDVGAKAVIKRNESETLEVEVDDEGILLDMDTPSDLKKAEAYLRARR